MGRKATNRQELVEGEKKRVRQLQHTNSVMKSSAFDLSVELGVVGVSTQIVYALT